jgi:hypothetical protein
MLLLELFLFRGGWAFTCLGDFADMAGHGWGQVDSECELQLAFSGPRFQLCENEIAASAARLQLC